MSTKQGRSARILVISALLLALAGCSSTPESPASASAAAEPGTDRVVCDSYLMQEMCVKDLSGDETVDLIYFADTNEIFMYQEGRKEQVQAFMPLHRCAVPLNPGMQTTTNRILHRKDMSLTEELDITRRLIVNYVAAKPSIDACNERYEAENGGVAHEEELVEDEFDWGED